MRNCFVPGCDQRHKNSPKRPMFLAPKDMLQKWIEVLPKLRTFKPHDKVCHLHFLEDDIITTYDHMINGKIYQLQRGRSRLNPNAVPLYNLPTPEEINSMSKYSRKNIKSATRRKPATLATITKAKALEESSIDIEIQRVAEEQENDNMEVVVQMNSEEEEEDEEEGAQNPASIEEVYSHLYDNIDMVRLPSTLWGTHRAPDRSAMFFTYLDIKHLTCSHVVSISRKGSLKAFQNKSLRLQIDLMHGVHNIDALSDLLAQIDAQEYSTQLV